MFCLRGCAEVFLFTDFGAEGPYLAQVQAVLAASAPGMPRFNLLSNAPAGDPRRAAYLLENGCVAMAGAADVLLDDPQLKKAYLGL